MLEKIYKMLVPLMLFVNVALIIQMNILPYKITKDVMTTLNLPASDTITINVGDKLLKKHEMVYFKGETIKVGVKLNDKFEYNPKYPKEFLDGYLILAQFNDGGKYFIWSNSKLAKGEELDGWYVTLSGTWQNEEDYINVLLPVVERKK